jgi:poly-gamma-glutamate synthesis protein (capsule biosynthesis protein)
MGGWTYALAAPFPTLSDETTFEDLKALWHEGKAIGEEGKKLLVDENTLQVFTALWGKPSTAVVLAPTSSLLDRAWQEKTTWAILPFEQLEPRWKVLILDGQSPIHKDFDPGRYPLQVPVSLSGDPTIAAQIAGEHGPNSLTPRIMPGNRQADRLTTVILTGTTSLVRATAALMELHGMDYPAQDIGPWLRTADILQISNEIAFAKNCPSPLPHSGLLFCSQERYIQLLETIGTRVVDLSGDHLDDYGPEALINTIQLYHQRGWQTYGGGLNIEAGRQPALFENNVNKIAFLGCNYKQPGYSTASATSPGAVHCDPAWLYPAIQKLKSAGYLVIVTLQDDEYMEAIARPKLKTDFRGAADAGAAIVSGTQSHQPQAFDFRNGVFIHYGLGNLFFDQIHSWETTNEAFVDRHVIYNNRVISTEVLTTIFVDFARPRPMTPEERRTLLKMIFAASGW